jgi:hypothetical protein
MSSFVTDCLVLKLEEYDVTLKVIDTTIYVLYDSKENQYIVRGSRMYELRGKESCAYSFVCNDEYMLADFIKYIFCKKNKITEILYNYDNLPHNSNDITFDFLQKYDEKHYEISGYNKLKMSRKRLIRNLKMLKNVFNYYN